MKRREGQKPNTGQAEARAYPAFFRTSDIPLFLCMIAAAMILLTISAYRNHAAVHSPQLQILVGNHVYGTYDLQEDQVIRIGETNVCEIRNGEVRMTEADCPDQICVHTRPISAGGGSIVCLPNQIVLRITEADTHAREVDTIAE